VHNTITTYAPQRRRPAWPARQRGVTMAELVIVMMIVAIITAIGVPMYRHVTTDNRMATEVNALLGDMEYARSEAVREGRTITVCVAGSVTSPYSCAGGATDTWQNGWIVFVDVNDNQTIASDQDVLRVQAPFTSGDTFESNYGVSSVSFNRDGFAYTGEANVTITLKNSSNDTVFTRCLLLSQSGMMTSALHQTDPTDCP
jgi:type IV fimbrial biogenesis protein FimT